MCFAVSSLVPVLPGVTTTRGGEPPWICFLS